MMKLLRYTFFAWLYNSTRCGLFLCAVLGQQCSLTEVISNYYLIVIEPSGLNLIDSVQFRVKSGELFQSWLSMQHEADFEIISMVTP